MFKMVKFRLKYVFLENVVYLYGLDVFFQFFFLCLQGGDLSSEFIDMVISFVQFSFSGFFCFFSGFNRGMYFFYFILQNYVVVFRYGVGFMCFVMGMLFIFNGDLYFLKK